jgi:hypothetical protein
MSGLEISVSGQINALQIELTPSAFEARRVALVKASAVPAEITGISDLDAAAGALTTIKALTKAVEESRKDVKGPLLDTGRKIDAVAKDFVDSLNAEASRLSTMVGAYQEAQRRKAERVKAEEAQKQQEAIIEMQTKQAALQSEGKLDAAAADALRAEAADKIAESQLAAMKAEGPKADGVVTRTSWKFDVTDIDALHAARPDLCVITPNNAAIRAVIKNGKSIPGLRIWQEAAAVVRGAAKVNVEQYDY